MPTIKVDNVLLKDSAGVQILSTDTAIKFIPRSLFESLHNSAFYFFIISHSFLVTAEVQFGASSVSKSASEHVHMNC